MLFRSLIRRALRVVRDRRLVEALAGLGVEDVVGRGVDEPPDPGAFGRAGQVAAATAFTRSKIASSGTHCSGIPIELKTISQPSVAAARLSASVASPRKGSIPAGRTRRAPWLADERPHLLAAVEQRRGDGVADLAGRPCDEDAHRRILWTRR